MSGTCAIGIALGLLCGQAHRLADAPPLTLLDLEPCRDALRETPPASADLADFRRIWNADIAERGRWIEVRGRVERRFRQAAVGEVPPLVEEWLRDQQGELWCVLRPASGELPPALGAEARFTGRYLRLLRYRAGDGDRVAPLVASGGVLEPLPAGSSAPVSGARTELWIAAALGLFVVLIVSTLHLRRRHRKLPAWTPPPDFFVTGPANERVD